MKQPWIKLSKDSTKNIPQKTFPCFFSSSSKMLGYSIKIKQCQQKARKSLMQSWTLDCLWATHATNLTLDSSKMLCLIYRFILQEGSSINISWLKTSKGKSFPRWEKGMNRMKWGKDKGSKRIKRSWQGAPGETRIKFGRVRGGGRKMRGGRASRWKNDIKGTDKDWEFFLIKEKILFSHQILWSLKLNKLALFSI